MRLIWAKEPAQVGAKHERMPEFDGRNDVRGGTIFAARTDCIAPSWLYRLHAKTKAFARAAHGILEMLLVGRTHS